MSGWNKPNAANQPAEKKGGVKSPSVMKGVIVGAVAVVSQAAQFKWNAGAIKTFDGKANYSGTAILTVIAADNSTQTYTGTFADGYIMDGSGNKGLIVGESGDMDGFIKKGSAYSAYYTITDKDGNVFTSTTKNNLTATAQTVKGIAFMAAGEWAAVPEPTSGLLLLLGVGSLALRRRRA